MITVLNGWAVQSIGYSTYLPLGRPEILAENFDRWQLDEILVVAIDAGQTGDGPRLDIVEAISRMQITTPLSYLGGIRGPGDAKALINAGADRVVMESLFIDDPDEAGAVAAAIGRQAVIRAQPMHLENGRVLAHDPRGKYPDRPIDALGLLESTNQPFSELFLIDWKNEGKAAAFDSRLLAPFLNTDLQLICFGGISEKTQVSALFDFDCVSAAAVGNALSWKELAHRDLMKATEVDAVRAISYGKVTRGAREW
ncbi:MAG: HisA/HisF-related TIM barrel protein [Pseudomonadota bacterium]